MTSTLLKYKILLLTFCRVTGFSIENLVANSMRQVDNFMSNQAAVRVLTNCFTQGTVSSLCTGTPFPMYQPLMNFVNNGDAFAPYPVTLIIAFALMTADASVT